MFITCIVAYKYISEIDWIGGITVYRNNIRNKHLKTKAAFTPGQHVARQHVAVNMFLVSATKLLPVCCPSVAGYKGIPGYKYPERATCCRITCVRQHYYMYPDTSYLQHVARTSNMLLWCKRGLKRDWGCDDNWLLFCFHAHCINSLTYLKYKYEDALRLRLFVSVFFRFLFFYFILNND